MTYSSAHVLKGCWVAFDGQKHDGSFVALSDDGGTERRFGKDVITYGTIILEFAEKMERRKVDNVTT